MAKKSKFTRRGFFPIIGGSLLIPFLGSAKNATDDDTSDEYQILLKPDGTSVKVRKSILKQSAVKKKNISNKTFLKWIGKKV